MIFLMILMLKLLTMTFYSMLFFQMIDVKIEIFIFHPFWNLIWFLPLKFILNHFSFCGIPSNSWPIIHLLIQFMISPMFWDFQGNCHSFSFLITFYYPFLGMFVADSLDRAETRRVSGWLLFVFCFVVQPVRKYGVLFLSCFFVGWQVRTSVIWLRSLSAVKILWTSQRNKLEE